LIQAVGGWRHHGFVFAELVDDVDFIDFVEFLKKNISFLPIWLL